jgi:prepilin-type N-terminal cleavage/methylation domain-containing protein
VDIKIRKTNQKGFSLVEVLVAITLFALFITAFLTSQGYNVTDSQLSEEQLMLQQLAERKINELFLEPPKFQNIVGNFKETKTFEGKDLSNYEYTLELKKLTIPDLTQLAQNQASESEESANDEGGNYFDSPNSQRNVALEKLVFEELKKNIERMVWQARVTVTNKETKYSYSLATWLTNYNERAQINIGM